MRRHHIQQVNRDAKGADHINSRVTVKVINESYFEVEDVGVSDGIDDFEPLDSEVESEKGEFDVYREDPVFDTKEGLHLFMKNCGIDYRKKKDYENICHELVFVCSFGSCGGIWSDDFQHLCCQQIDKYAHWLTLRTIHPI